MRVHAPSVADLQSDYRRGRQLNFEAQACADHSQRGDVVGELLPQRGVGFDQLESFGGRRRHGRRRALAPRNQPLALRTRCKKVDVPATTPP